MIMPSPNFGNKSFVVEILLLCCRFLFITSLKINYYKKIKFIVTSRIDIAMLGRLFEGHLLLVLFEKANIRNKLL